MKKIRVMVGILLTVMLLAACGAASKKTMDMAMAPTYEESEKQEASHDSGFGVNGGMEERIAETPKSEPASQSEGATSAMEALQSRKLIKYISLELETLNFDEFIPNLTHRVEAVGGYIENSSISGNGYNYYNSHRYANIVARVPVSALDAFLAQIDEEANVTYRNESTQDITLQYTDTEAHKKELKIQQERLLELMETAENMEDLLTIESRLSEIRYELESYETMLRTYDNQVDYTTVTISISEVERETPIEDETISDRIKNKWNNNIYNITDNAVAFFVWFVAALPYFALWGAAIAIAVVAARKVMKKKKSGRAKTIETVETGVAEDTSKKQS